MKLPDIKIMRRGREGSIEIDGQEFQYPVAAGSIVVQVDNGDVPSVTLTLLAESVEVQNTSAPSSASPGRGERA